MIVAKDTEWNGMANTSTDRSADHPAQGRPPGHRRGVVHQQLRGRLAVGETVIWWHPPVPLVGVSIWINRGCRQNDSLADSYRRPATGDRANPLPLEPEPSNGADLNSITRATKEMSGR